MIKDELQRQHDAWKSMGIINPLQQAVLDHGVVHNPAKFKGYGRRRKAKECFRNSILLSTRYPSLRYVEGYATHNGIGILIDHAWCVDADGNVVDPTWEHPANSEYMGIEMDPAWARRKTFDQGYYGVLAGELIHLETICELFPEYENREWRCEPHPHFKEKVE